MAATYTLSEAKSSLRELVKRAAAGEEMVISDGDELQARLVPVAKAPRRQPGGWEGRVKIMDSFDDPLPEEIQAAFEGRN